MDVKAKQLREEGFVSFENKGATKTQKRSAKLQGELRRYPHPGCFCKRVRICLIQKDLAFFGATNSVQQYVSKGVSLVRRMPREPYL
jgi:hypothetical protein